MKAGESLWISTEAGQLVLYVRKHDILKVKWADNNSRYTNINKEMRKELKKIYDDSEIESINS